MRIKTSHAIALAAFFGIATFGIGFAGVKNAEKKYLAIEASYPESAISTYFQHLKDQDYDVIYNDSLKVDSHLNSKEDYVAELQKVFDGVSTNQIEYTGLDNTDGSKEYKLYNNGTYLTTLRLIQSSDGSWIASTIFNGDLTYQIEVPVGEKILVNGIELSDAYLLSTDVAASNFDGMNDTASAPKVDVYEVKNLLGQPDVSIAGNIQSSCLTDVLSNHILVGYTASDSTLESTLIDDAMICAQFPAQDTTLASVQAISYRNSDWYSRISGMQNYWFTDHTTSSFSNQQVLKVIQQSDDTAVAHVVFDYYASNGEVERTWNCGYQMTMINVNGTWQICAMAIDNELNPTKAAWYQALNE